ncbi:MAG TPA: asparagine synthase C-terminal domain-containing protein, partial [Pyrinomonadaceae bacterium]|nr:asparagine synthase C-terminal domain-containing protein [Pyrinomonadaceae bacterium]
EGLPSGLGGTIGAPIRNLVKFARSAGQSFEDRYLGFSTYFTGEMKNRVLNSEVACEISHFDPYFQHREYLRKCRSAEPLNRILYLDFKTFLPALNLDTTDRTSMAANLEVRAPYLNRKLLDLAEKIPPIYKIKGLKRKYILKKALESYLPKDLVWRKKAGFSAPVRSWLRGGLKPMVEELLGEEAIKKRGIYSTQGVKEILEDYKHGRRDYALHIYLLLNFEIFAREFLDGDYRSRLS